MNCTAKVWAVLVAVCGCTGPVAPPEPLLGDDPDPPQPIRDKRPEPQQQLANAQEPTPPAPKAENAPTDVEIRMSGQLLAGPAFSVDGKQMVTGSGGELRVWSVPDAKELMQFQLPDKETVTVSFADDGKHIISVHLKDKKIRHWSLATGKQVKEIELPQAKDVQWAVGFSPGGKHLAVKVLSGVYLAEPLTGKVTVGFAGACPGEMPWRPSGGGFSPDLKRFATGTEKGRFGVWDVATGKQLATGSEKHESKLQFTVVRFSPNGRWVATAGFHVGYPVCIWDAATGEFLTELKVNGSYTGGLVWTPDSNAIICHGNFDASAFDVATGKAIHKFRPFGQDHGWNANPCDTTPDRKYAVFMAMSSPTKEKNQSAFEQSVFLCPLPAPKKVAGPKDELTEVEFDTLWADVTTENKIRYEQIIGSLAAASRSAVPYLVKKVPPVTVDDVKAIRKLIADLDADAPATRKAAQAQLSTKSHRFEDVLREGLADAPPGDIRNRLTFLLSELQEKPQPMDLLAELRVIEILVRLNTVDARKALEMLAAGVPKATVTREAKAALEKLPPKP